MYKKIEFQDKNSDTMSTVFIKTEDIQILWLHESPEDGRIANFILHNSKEKFIMYLGDSECNDGAWEKLKNIIS